MPVGAAVGALLALAALTACGSSSGGGGKSASSSGTPSPSGSVIVKPSANAGRWSLSRMGHAHPIGHPGVSHTPPPTPSNARVGALFSHDASGDHFCTASVVDSPGGSVIITAGHCINTGPDGGYKSDLAFVPGYRAGQTPNGTWTIRKMFVDTHWADSRDPDYDYGFAVLNKLDGHDIETVLGANRFGYDEGFGKGVKITGYPASADYPISCVNRTTKFQAHQMKVDCTGYSGGTSGSPWLSNFDPATRTGEVIGVIGGYKGGGDTDDTSYSSYFDKSTKALYDEAVAAGG